MRVPALQFLLLVGAGKAARYGFVILLAAPGAPARALISLASHGQ